MTAPRRSAPVLPRLLNREQAAGYCGVGVTKFDEMVKDGRMPKPRCIDARRLWDVRQLDAAVDDLPVEGELRHNPWDDAA